MNPLPKNSLVSILSKAAARNRGTPAVAVEGATVRDATIGQFATHPNSIIESIISMSMFDKPENHVVANASAADVGVAGGGENATTIRQAAITGSSPASASAASTRIIEFTPTGHGEQHIYGFLVEVSCHQNANLGQFKIGAYGLTSNANVSGAANSPKLDCAFDFATHITVDPAMQAQGTSKFVRVWIFPGVLARNGAYAYSPIVLRKPLDTATAAAATVVTQTYRPAIITLESGLGSSQAISVVALTRGSTEVEALLKRNAMAVGTHPAIRNLGPRQVVAKKPV